MIYIVNGSIYSNPHWCQVQKITDVGTKNIVEKLGIRFRVEMFILDKFMDSGADPSRLIKVGLATLGQ
jgi:hypothetical protein